MTADDGASTLIVLNVGDTASEPLTVQLPHRKSKRTGLALNIFGSLTVVLAAFVGMALQPRRAAGSTATK